MQPETSIQESLFGKTSQEHSAATEAQTSTLSSTKWATAGRWNKNGLCWMHSTSESPNGDDASSSLLSSILQSLEDVPTKYFLSAKAAEGILRRATRRGKTLPQMLEQALRSVSLIRKD